MAIQYKTLGMSNPQGKPRVYFCCHPQDFEAYFEPITNEILHIQDCAIWYDLSNAPLDEERQLDLRQMQLFVMPITTRLLTTPNVALSEEFPFAIQNHIPVLPIMLEGGLEELFNKKCGDLHFLDKTAHDPTVISYEEKLKKYVSSVLVGDELADKVRAAFDAYIFLSYRKKDRKYAQQLMRLIHQNDFCRDIAIWYDEYLLPGENFNAAIENMIRRSDLIALAVTPNLLEIPNYVLTEEYPRAKAAQKPILPVEAVSTDTEALQQTFHEIPACVHKGDDQQFSAALLDSLKQIALLENDSDPQHNFFIGLAYLNGIDVEVNHAMARKLITGAAETGLPEAVKKLAEMYHTGMGVERDCREAVRWQKKLVDLCCVAYKREKNEKNGRTFAIELWLLGVFTQEIGDIRAEKIVFQRMLAICKEMVKIYTNLPSVMLLLLSYESLADIDRNEGDLVQAREYAQKVLEISNRLIEETGMVEIQLLLLYNYSGLGEICREEGAFAQAKEYYQKELELGRQFMEKMDTAEIRLLLLGVYINLGSLCQTEGDLAQARKYYQMGAEVGHRLVKETGTVEAQRGLLSSYHYLGGICEAEGDLAQAREYYQKGLELCCWLVKETGTVEAQRGLLSSYHYLGGICEAEGDFAQAREYRQKGLELCRWLVEKTGTVRDRQGLPHCYSCLGDVCKNEGNLTQAKKYYRKSLKLSQQLAEETDTFRLWANLLVNYTNLAAIYEAERNLAQAREYYQKVMKLDCKLVGKTDLVQVRRQLLSSCVCLGDICYTESNFTQAKEYYQKSLELGSQFVEGASKFEARRLLLSVYIGLANISKAEGNPVQEIECYQQALRLSCRLAKETGTVQSYHDLALLYVRIALVSQGDEKRDMLTQAGNIWKMLSRKCPENLEFQQSLDMLNILKNFSDD